MDYPPFNLALPDGPPFAMDDRALPSVAPIQKGETMQATSKANGSAEIRIAEVLKEAEVKIGRWNWWLVAEVFFMGIAIAVLVWVVWPQ